MTDNRLKARSSPGIPFYTKIDAEFLREMAEVLTAGSVNYDPHLLIENWRLGDLEFFHDRANHLLEHIYKWLAGDRTEKHLAHAACNLQMLMFAEKRGIYNPLPVDDKMQAWVDYVNLHSPPDASGEKITDETQVDETINDDVNEANVTTGYEEEKEVFLDKLVEETISHTNTNGKPVIVPILEVNFEKVKQSLLG